jgi:NADPH-dependent 2,4-dienoyl-CoA reductase/sulfur reductase-like enzyme
VPETSTAHTPRTDPGEQTSVDALVVGGGIAGLRTAAELRAGGFAGSILLVGAETASPYDRTTLSVSALDAGFAPPDLAEQGLGNLAELDVTWWPGSRARRATSSPDDGADVEIVRPDSAVVTVRAGRVVAASGARAVSPPWPGVLTLRAAADRERLQDAIRPGARLVIVGAGWIGTEIASVAATAGATVTVVEAGDRPLQSVPRALGERAREWFGESGVELLTGVGVESVSGGDGDHVVTLTDGRTVGADVVLAALGARPETDWLPETVRRTAAGHVVVDGGGRAAGGPQWLWAAGDAAAIEDGADPVPGAHWEGALHHPAGVAASILGTEVPARPASYVFSEAFGHDIAVVGDPVGEPAIERDDDAGVTWLWTDSGGRLLAGATIDHPRDVPVLKRALDGGARPDVDLTAAADPAVRLRGVLR